MRLQGEQICDDISFPLFPLPRLPHMGLPYYWNVDTDLVSWLSPQTPALLLPNPPRSSGAVMQVSWPQGLLVDQGGRVRSEGPAQAGRLLEAKVAGGQGCWVLRWEEDHRLSCSQTLRRSWIPGHEKSD